MDRSACGMPVLRIWHLPGRTENSHEKIKYMVFSIAFHCTILRLISRNVLPADFAVKNVKWVCVFMKNQTVRNVSAAVTVYVPARNRRSVHHLMVLVKKNKNSRQIDFLVL